MASALPPRFIALRARNLYVEFRPPNSIMLSSQKVLSEDIFTRFEVISDSTPRTGLINIRTTFNGKFLTRNAQSLVLANVDEPQEDRLKPSCTLFRSVFNRNSNTLLLFHQQPRGEMAVGAQARANVIATGANALTFDVIDLMKLVLLPKNITFKGDNGNYLQSEFIRTRNRLQFGTENPLDRKVHHETYTQNNGDVRLRSITFDRFWRKSNPEWIFVDSTDTSANDRDTLFRPVRVDIQDNNIALLNLGNGKYCKRRVRGGQPRLIRTLIASATSIVPQAVMTVSEAIRDREIFDIRYHLDLARTYNVHPIIVEPREVINPTDQTVMQTADFTFTRITRETFSSSHSWKLSYEAKITVNFIPLLVQGEINWSATYEGEVKWETMNEEIISTSHGLTVPVPPRTRSLVTLIVERGTIDVPYSYRQRDILLDGRHVERTFDDGLFTGVNTYTTSRYNIQHFPLDPSYSRKFDEEELKEDDDEYDDEDEDEDEVEVKMKSSRRPSSRL